MGLLANVFIYRFEILRYNNHTCLLHDSSSPCHKGVS